MSKAIVISKEDKLEFIISHLNELRRMAASERYKVLTYLIEMAYVAACDIAREDRPFVRNGGGRRESAELVPMRMET